jgi:hypothetical protein
VREGWSAFDLETPAGIKLEIKTSAYLQSWFQNSLSKVSFSIRPAKHWDSSTNKLTGEPGRHADVYVFCLLHHVHKQTVDPLNLDQWEFYVVSTKELNSYTRSKNTISLKSLKKLVNSVSYDSLDSEIKFRYGLNSRL